VVVVDGAIVAARWDGCGVAVVGVGGTTISRFEISVLFVVAGDDAAMGVVVVPVSVTNEFSTSAFTDGNGVATRVTNGRSSECLI
jgi:hypothetical protein